MKSASASTIADRLLRAAGTPAQVPTPPPLAPAVLEALAPAPQPEPAAAVAPIPGQLEVRARRRRRPAPTVRYTIDLIPQERDFLRRLAHDNELDVSNLLRALLKLLDQDPVLVRRMLREAARLGPW